MPDYDDAQRGATTKVKGSAVNPVLREGNSDRRAPASVKAYARAHPHSMGAWSRDSRDARGDDGRRRLPLDRAVGHARRGRRAADRARRRRRRRDRAQGVGAGAGGRDRRRRGDAPARRSTRSSPSRSPTRKAQGVLFSVHLKATMMKVSDPIIFGHAVRAFFADVFAEHGDALDARRGDAEQRPGQHPDGDRVAARRRAGGDRGGHRARVRDAARRSRWSTPTAASPTCTCRAT